jgi:hypothetical protein
MGVPRLDLGSYEDVISHVRNSRRNSGLSAGD